MVYVSRLPCLCLLSFCSHPLGRHSKEANTYLEVLGDDPDELCFIDSYAWHGWVSSNCQYFCTRLSAEDEQKITSYPFMAFSMDVDDNHWILSIILYPGDLVLDASTHRTGFVILDSHSQQYPSIELPLHKLLGHLVRLQSGQSINATVLDALPVLYPELRKSLTFC